MPWPTRGSTGGGGSAATDISFATAIPLTNTAGAYMPQQTVSGPLAFSPVAGAVRGAFTFAPLVADGVNTPTCPGFTEHGSSMGWDNRAGILNLVQFFYLGGVWWYSISQAFNAAPAAVPDTTAPTLSSPTSASTGTTTGSGSVTTNEGNGTLYFLATINATETAATVKSSGATQAITTTGSKAVTVAGLTASTLYYIHFLHRDAAGNDSLVSNSASFTTAAVGDTTAPILSAPTATQTGANTASGSVTTDEANGTLYRLASVNAVESAATVKAAALTTTVTATGAQAVSFAGLAAATVYYAHYVHRDTAGNDSLVSSSASFVTAAAPAGATTTAVTLANLANNLALLSAGEYGGGNAGVDTSAGRGNAGALALAGNGMITVDWDVTADPVAIGFDSVSNPNSYQICDYFCWLYSDGQIYWASNSGTTTAIRASAAPGAAVRYGLSRTGDTVSIVESLDSGATWGTVFTFAAKSTATLYPVWFGKTVHRPRAAGLA